MKWKTDKWIGFPLIFNILKIPQVVGNFYKSYHNISVGSSNQRFYCDNSTSIYNSCAQMACQCDVHFVNRIFDQLENFDTTTSLSSGFDRDNECVSGYSNYGQKQGSRWDYPWDRTTVPIRNRHFQSRQTNPGIRSYLIPVLVGSRI